MTEGAIAALVVLLLLLVAALLAAVQLVRLSRAVLRDVFSRDRGVLKRRVLVGLADMAYAILVAFFFFSGDVGVPAVQATLAFVCLAVFVLGLVLWLLAVLQLFGLLLEKPKPGPAEPPPQSNP